MPTKPIAGLRPENRERLYLGHLARMRHGVFEITGTDDFCLVRAGMDNAKFRETLSYFAHGRMLIGNGKNFMAHFDDAEVEQSIGNRIVRFITDRARIVKGPGSDLPDDLFD